MLLSVVRLVRLFGFLSLAKLMRLVTLLSLFRLVGEDCLVGEFDELG